MKFELNIKADIDYALESKKLDLPTFCENNGLNRKSVYNQIENPNNFQILNKIYNSIYDLGLRVNKAKSEIFDEQATKNEIALFHGSKIGLTDITPTGSRNDCDFGGGFYLTKFYDSALSFIDTFKESTVYAFRLDLKNLKVLELEPGIEWMILICYFRKQIEMPKIYLKLLEKINSADVIIAPIADNKMFEILNEFKNGEITTTQALHALSASRLGKQYVLKTDKAIKNLKFLNKMFVCDKEKENSTKDSQERANEIESKIFYAKREFRNQGQYIDEILK